MRTKEIQAARLLHHLADSAAMLTPAGQHRPPYGTAPAVAPSVTAVANIGGAPVHPAAPDAVEESTHQFVLTLQWFCDEPLHPNRKFIIHSRGKQVSALGVKVKYRLDSASGLQHPAGALERGMIGNMSVTTEHPVDFAPFLSNAAPEYVLLTDPLTNAELGAGIIMHALRRATNVIWQQTDITCDIRKAQKQQEPVTLWFTGLSGSGKSTLANNVEKALVGHEKHTMLLDGDNVRHGLCKDLGFSEVDRIENIRRIAETAKLMNDAGLITLVSCISPHPKDRERARNIIGERFIEVYVSTSLEECERRDIKGLYTKARAGEIPNFTGITAPYIPPESPDITVDTEHTTVEEATDHILALLRQNSQFLQ